MNLELELADHNRRADPFGDVMPRLITIALITALLASACGNALDGVGELSRRIVHGDDEEIAVTTVAESTGIGLRGITDLVWWPTEGAARCGHVGRVRAVGGRALRRPPV
jgi:hypothetical protein